MLLRDFEMFKRSNRPRMFMYEGYVFNLFPHGAKYLGNGTVLLAPGVIVGVYQLSLRKLKMFPAMERLNVDYNTIGSDPEMFVVDSDGEAVAASEIIVSKHGTVANDGFQIELHPGPSSCRQSAAAGVGSALVNAFRISSAAGLRLSFDMSKTITDKVWEKADEETRAFGCGYTENVYEVGRERISGLEERFRTAGGHIHMGIPSMLYIKRGDVLVKLLDILVGIPSVILDQNPDNARRREHYGRAGEHRVKEYGIEYRVPSNFWLKSYTVFSLLTAQMRQAAAIAQRDSLYEKFINAAKISDVQKAINNNDVALAKKIMGRVLRVYEKEDVFCLQGLSAEYITALRFLFNHSEPMSLFGVKERTDEIIQEWATRSTGFEKFINNLSKEIYTKRHRKS